MATTNLHSRLELWGGVECTVNRVGDIYLDQLRLNGHAHRIDDLDRFAELGLRTLRYPFLWERIAPGPFADADWQWPAQRLARMRALGITPIAGLLHHGSGPRNTSLLDPAFPEKFSAYAREFAKRFPDVELYTPINEPLTTARFSALYGRWYPHRQNELDFVRALFNQCRGIVLAIREIRKINPRAQLVQTEDLGKATGTPLLKYQADFENHRRWLSVDLLCGKINRRHYLWKHLRESGASETEILWFADNPSPPDIAGFNHYVLSNRFLDEKIERYPSSFHGGNGRHVYADIEAVRVAHAPPIPIDHIMREAWQRYKIPLAVTEIHLDCTREEQMRWLNENFERCKSLREQGVDIRAVTVWGLLGHYDWHCFVTKCEGYYESGVYDMRGGTPRPTGLARVVKDLAERGVCTDPVLQVPGWWARPSRVNHPTPVSPPAPETDESFGSSTSGTAHVAPILITGGTGTLGRAFAKLCETRGLPYRLLTRQQLDITKSDCVRRVFAEVRPWAVVNAAGYVRVDQAELERDQCFRENVDGPINLANECARMGLPFLSFSSDLVFDGHSSVPYCENSPVGPLSVYGHSKARAETGILGNCPNALVVRTSAFFGPWDHANFLHTSLERLRRGGEVVVPEAIKVSPTYVPDLVNVSLNLLLDRVEGIIHLTNGGEITWGEFAKLAASHAQLDPAKIVERPVQQLAYRARRPAYSVLGSEHGDLMPPLEVAIESYFAAVTSEARRR